LIDAVAEDAPEQTIASLIATFVQRTARLAAVMRDILRRTQGGTPAAVDPLAFSAAQ
jgi:hypothetical protein